MKIDLHIHTTYSDGVLDPIQIIQTAQECELDCIALTDHDNILSWGIAGDYVKKNDIKMQIIPGVEINTIYKGFEVHILGYFMDSSNKDFIELINVQQKARIEQTHKIISLLNKKAGLKIKFEDVQKLVAPKGSIGRPHIARAITSCGGSANVMEAYAKFINNNSEVYVERKTVSPHDAVEIISEAKGIPVFAHPIDVDIADELTKEFIDFLSQSKKFCPHFHLSLQSCCDETLKAMNRHYSVERVKELVKYINQKFALCYIGSDIIAGFAGETDENFQITKQNLEELNLSKMHVFPYSRRTGTIADKLPNQIDEKTKKERCSILQELSNKKLQEFLNSNIGKEHEVIIEKTPDKKTNLLKGVTSNYINVLIDGDNTIKDTLQKVRITGFSNQSERMMAELITK